MPEHSQDEFNAIQRESHDETIKANERDWDEPEEKDLPVLNYIDDLLKDLGYILVGQNDPLEFTIDGESIYKKAGHCIKIQSIITKE